MQQSVALLRVPTNLLVFIQGLFGCLPWGVLLTYLTDYLAQNKGLSVPTATVVRPLLLAFSQLVSLLAVLDSAWITAMKGELSATRTT